MCRVCEIRKEMDTKMEEVYFRIVQYQKEKAFGKQEAAIEAQRRALECLSSVFPMLDEAQEKMREMDNDRGSMSDLLKMMLSRKDEGGPVH